MAVDVLISQGLISYEKALSFMQHRVDDIIEKRANQCLWFLEHSSVYTAGASSNDNDLLDKTKFPVYKTGRGGKYTYHGPGQRVVYVMLDLKEIHKPQPDIKLFVKQLEQWVIAVLGCFGIQAYAIAGRVGIWVKGPKGEDEKIAAIGIRLKKWVSYHGIAINLDPDLTHFDGIIPCGLKDSGVSSIERLSKGITFKQLDMMLLDQFCKIFNTKLGDLTNI